MAHEQDFWKKEFEEGGQNFWVCMTCLNEVFWRKIPQPDCPTCHGYNTYDNFTCEGIKSWGTPDLVEKAYQVKSEVVRARLLHESNDNSCR